MSPLPNRSAVITLFLNTEIFDGVNVGLVAQVPATQTNIPHVFAFEAAGRYFLFDNQTNRKLEFRKETEWEAMLQLTKQGINPFNWERELARHIRRQAVRVILDRIDTDRRRSTRIFYGPHSPYILLVLDLLGYEVKYVDRLGYYQVTF